MRIAFAVALAGCIGCSAGDKLGASGMPSAGGTGTGTGGAGGTTMTMGAGGSAMPGAGGTTGGSVGNGGSTSDSGGSTSGSGAGGSSNASNTDATLLSACADPNAVGPTPLRRLSQLEYSNSVRDLFGATVALSSLPSDDSNGVFNPNTLNPMTADQFTAYDTVAQAVADGAAQNLAQASGCGASDAACIKGYLDGKARQAFHGVLEADDKQALESLYDSLATTDPTLAASTAVHFIVDSPRFLYVVEFGTPNGTLSRLSPSELAGRLASFLWRSVPDTALLSAADTGGLADADGIRTQATRMFQDPKAQPVLRQFVNDWLALSVSTGTDATAQALDAETGAVFTALAQGTGSYGDLFTTTASQGDQSLAAYYGVAVSADGSLQLPANRAGLLLRAAFMRSHIKGDLGSPTQRGKVVRSAMLCDPPSPPSQNVDMSVATPMNGQTAQDVFDQHANNPMCAGCHSLMDPIGSAFGSYGPDGVYNPALTKSTAGTIVAGNTNDFSADFADTAGLMNLLGTSTVPEQCFAVQTTRFALGRKDSSADACGLADIWTAFKNANFSLQTLFVEVATSSLMQERNTVKAGEACQ
jgi:hypothetical protein